MVILIVASWDFYIRFSACSCYSFWIKANYTYIPQAISFYISSCLNKGYLFIYLQSPEKEDQYKIYVQMILTSVLDSEFLSSLQYDEGTVISFWFAIHDTLIYMYKWQWCIMAG